MTQKACFSPGCRDFWLASHTVRDQLSDHSGFQSRLSGFLVGEQQELGRPDMFQSRLSGFLVGEPAPNAEIHVSVPVVGIFGWRAWAGRAWPRH